MRFVFHNPHTSIWFKKPLYFYLTGRKCAVKYEYLLDYCIHNNVNFAFFCDGSDFSFGRSFFSGRFLAKIELMLWCLLNKINPFEIKIITRLDKLNDNDILFSFLYGNFTSVYRDSDRRDNSQKNELAKKISDCKAFKAVHLTHYMFDIKNGTSNTKAANIDLFIAENNLARNSPFFRYYYDWYKGDVYTLPYVPQNRFKKIKDFRDRINKAVATGTLLYKMEDAAFLSFFGAGELHPIRRTIYENRENLSTVVDCHIHETEESKPSFELTKRNHLFGKLHYIFYIFYRAFFVKQKRYFSFDIVDLYNSYKMFIVPEEIIDLPGIGFIEGMACGSVYLGKKDPMYSDLGLIDGVNYIAYDGTLNDLVDKIQYYQKNEDLLEKISNNSYNFVQQKTKAEMIVKSLFEHFEKAIQNKRKKLDLRDKLFLMNPSVHSKNLFIRLKNRIQKSILNNMWRNIHHVLKSDQFNVAFKTRFNHVQEVEHQVGRFLNMQVIIEEIKKTNLDGDVVEFGTWQGLGLLFFERLFNSRSMKFIGIDSFEGLPVDSTIWRRGMFNNTSVEFVKRNIKKYCPQSFEQFQLIKGWFSDSNVCKRLYQITDNIILVHYDADIGISTTQALEIIRPYLINRNKPIYFLFDDWGSHPDEVPDAFLNWVEINKSVLKFNLVKLSSTRFTRYYRLDFYN